MVFNSARCGFEALVCPYGRKISLALGVTIGMFLVCMPLFSQGNAGRILGAITDQTGGAISGATVTITDTQRGVSRTLVTDPSGEYNAPNLLPGAYTIRAEYKGFRNIERQNIVLEVNQDLRVDLQMQPGEQAQTVTVTEALPLVQTTSAELVERPRAIVRERGRQSAPRPNEIPRGAERYGDPARGAEIMKAIDNASIYPAI